MLCVEVSSQKAPKGPHVIYVLKFYLKRPKYYALNFHLKSLPPPPHMLSIKLYLKSSPCYALHFHLKLKATHVERKIFNTKIKPPMLIGIMR